MEGAVGRHGAQYLADRTQPALASGGGAFDHEGRGAHAEDHPVAAPVERDRRVLHDVVGGGGAGGQESGADPFEEVVAGDVVASDHDHALGAPGADPVLGERHRLGGAGTGRVDVGVGSAGPDQLGELRVAHGQDAEQEAPVEGVGLAFEGGLELVDLIVEIGQHAQRARHGLAGARAQPLEERELLAAGAIDVEAGEVGREGVVTGKRGAEDDAGVVAQRFGQHPAVGEQAAFGGGPVVHDQRDSRVAQSVEAGADREPRDGIQRGHALERHAELVGEVETPGPAGELDHVARAGDGLEARLAVRFLGEARDVLVEDRAPEARRDQIDEALAVENSSDVGVVEDPLDAWQAEGRAGDHHGFRRTLGGAAAIAAVHLPAAFQHLGEHPSQIFELARGCCARGRWRRSEDRRRRAWWRARGHGARSACDLDGARFARASHAQPRGVEAAQRLVEADAIAELGVVGVERERLRTVGEHVVDEARQRALRANLHEEPNPRCVERLEPLHELHRGGDLTGQDVEHPGHRVRTARVELAIDVGHHRDARRRETQLGEGASQRLARRRHDRRVERVADVERHRAETRGAESLDRQVDGVRAAADDRLLAAVQVGDHHVAADRRQDPLDLGERRHDRRHAAVVGHRDVGHLAAAGAHRLQRVGERQPAGGDQRAVLAEAVAHHHVGHHAVGREQPGERGVDGQHRRLRDGGPAQVLFGARHGGGVARVDEQVVGERLAEERGHHPIRLGEGVARHRLGGRELLAHVRVLRSLSGVEERNFRRGPLAEEDSLTPQRLPCHRVGAGERLLGAVDLVGELTRVPVVDGDPARRAQVELGGRDRRGRAAPRSLGLEGGETRQQIGARRGAHHQRPAQRRGQRSSCRGAGRRADVLAHRDLRVAMAAGEQARHVLFEDQVEVGAPEAEGAQACAPYAARRLVPRAQLGVDPKRRVLEVDVRIGSLEVEARRQQLLVQRHHRLEQTRGAGGGLEMADVRFHGAQRDRAARQRGGAEHLGQALGLDDVSHLGGRAVALHQRGGGGRERRVLPRAGDGELLTHGIGRGDALALAVARAADAADHGVDAIAVALGVGEALEQEDRGAFAHHEAVGARRVRPGAGGGERPDLAELHECAGAHVAIDAAGDDRVEVALVEALDGGADRRHRRRARRVDDVVRAVEVEEVGDPPGDAVRELARHRVLGDLGQPLAHRAAELGGDGGTYLGGELAEARCGREGFGVLGEEHAQRGEVVLLAGHRVAEDHGGAIEVELARWVAEVDERLARAGDRPLLAVVHRVGDRRQDAHAPVQRLPCPVADPAADLRVALVGRLGVGVEVTRGIPAIR